MNGIVKVNLGGKDRFLRFNNFANTEIAKVLYESKMADTESKDPEMPNFFNAIMELNRKNHYLLIKVLVYSGIIGNDYVVGFNESVTMEEVGEWIGDAHPDEIVKVWEAFMPAVGTELKSDEEEADPAATPKKKYSSPTKKQYKKPEVN